jgi:hypothetical protein
MGHQIEYFASVPELNVRRWLDQLDGFYCSDPGDVPFCWEGGLRSGGTFWANMAPEVGNFSLAMKYSGFYHRQPIAVDFARRFEAEFWAACGAIPLLRLDEYLLGEWHQAVGREWEDLTNPVEELRTWLQSRDSHWDWLVPDPSG